MTKRLEGTVTLVTGASSGIGEATAVALADEGATVALVARRRDRLEALAERLGGAGKALVIEADVTDPTQAERAVATTVAELGRLDTLVNNAGVMLLGPIVDAPLEEWQRMVNLNVLGLLYCTHAALPHLLAAAEREPRSVADVINVSSVAGRVARLNSGVASRCARRSRAATCVSRSLNPVQRRPSWPLITGRRSSRGWHRPSGASSSCRRRTSPRASGTP
jgi:NADP-dependent 3-hydroxy acid dehydrogenase YdfG